MAQKRSIFEEVDPSAATPAARTAQPGAIDRRQKGSRSAVRIWLIVLFAMVLAMIVIGGLTRLTDSGLSIVEWAPVTGALPPMDETAWQGEFEAYQQIPQYRELNLGMTLAEFKQIYWWEWSHRQLGRAVGVVWLLGYLGLLITGQIPNGWKGRLIIPGALGGLQGAIGWWMVSSGLGEGMVSVASYRLAAHLGLAFIILGLIAWYVFRLARPEREIMQARRLRERKLWGMSTGLLHLAFLQILLGALVAGIDAGRTYIDWPLMAGGFFPSEPFELRPLWRNFFEDPGLVQFIHRMTAYLLFIFGLVVWRRGRKSAHPRTRTAFDWMAVALFGQVVLGIATVMQAAQMHIAITHQLMAVILWVLILRARFLAGYPVTTSIREGRA